MEEIKAKDDLEEKVNAAAKRLLASKEAQKEGKGILELENPIISGDTKVSKLPYDFLSLTGTEYADAMDADPNANNSYKITRRQALNLFATAAAKEVPELDKIDILERISIVDSVIAIQVASVFFVASTNAGYLRITKR